METTTLKNTAFVNNQVLNFYEKTSQHLFVRNDSSFFKLLIIEKDGKKYAVRLAFNKFNIDIEVWHENRFNDYSDVSTLLEKGKDNSAAKVAKFYAKKCDIFKPWQGPYKSIKNFKLMKESIEKAKEIIKEDIELITVGDYNTRQRHRLELEKKLSFLKEIPLKK